jgi:hypothetical protein
MAMQNPKITISNGIEVIEEREMTGEEKAELKKTQDDLIAQSQLELDQANAKAQAKAIAEGKLAALGLTTDDLRALGL